MKNIIIFFIIIFIVGCDSKVKIEKKLNYNYIETDECFFPIHKMFKLNKNYRRYTSEGLTDTMGYTYEIDSEYSKEVPESSYSVSIGERTSSYSIEYKGTKLDVRNSKEHKRYKRGKFYIIEFIEKGKTREIFKYYIRSNKSIIFIENSDEKELAYLLDYCESTWKK